MHHLFFLSSVCRYVSRRIASFGRWWQQQPILVLSQYHPRPLSLYYARTLQAQTKNTHQRDTSGNQKCLAFLSGMALFNVYHRSQLLYLLLISFQIQEDK
jgi:hypothetical protein